MEKQATTKSAKRRERRRANAALTSKINEVQKQNLTFPEAYKKLDTFDMVTSSPSNVQTWLRSLSYKALHRLLQTAVSTGLVSSEEVVDAFRNGRPNFRNQTIWKILQAGVLDDLPDIFPVKSILSRFSPSSKMLPYLADTFNFSFENILDKLIEKGMELSMGFVGNLADKVFSGSKTPMKRLLDTASSKQIEEVASAAMFPRGGGIYRPVSYKTLTGRITGVTPVQPQAVADSYSLVNTDAIRSYFCPDLYASLFGSDDLQPVALLSGSITYTLSTNELGNATVVIYPKNVAGSKLAFYRNDTTFDPVSGGSSVVGDWNTQFLSYSAFMNYARVTSYSVTIDNIAPQLTTSGFVQTFPFATVPVDGVAPIIIPSSYYPAQPYYHGTSLIDTQMYQINRAAIGFEDLTLVSDTFTQTEEGVAVLVTGAPVSQAVLNITITQIVEWTPVGSYRRLIQTQVPPIAPATRQCIAAIIRARPELVSNQRDVLRSFVKTLPTGLVEYSDIIRFVQ